MKTLIELIIKENKFEDYKIYENKVELYSFLSNLLVKYKDQTNNKYSLKKFVEI